MAARCIAFGVPSPVVTFLSSRRSLNNNRPVRPPPPHGGRRVGCCLGEASNAVELVSVGRPLPNSQVRICADDDQDLLDGTIGHILISGANVTKGYFEDAQPSNAASFRRGWLAAHR